MTLITRRLPTGQEVSQVDPAEAALLYREIFVEGSYARPGFPAFPPRVVFDIGANIGLASMWFQSCWPGVAVVAAEPGPDPYEALRANLARHVPGGVAYNVAVAERTGPARFGYYPGAPAESGLYADQDGDVALASKLLVEAGVGAGDAERLARIRHRIRYVDTPMVTVSDLLRACGHDRVDLLKVDVEKAEWDVLAGIEERDWPRIANIVLEVHDLDGRLAAVAALLRGKGFTIAVEQERRLAGTDMHMVFATRGD
jgi:FkbM family methyltransferase